MAWCLIIGCGCRGRLLARELVARGHAVRATTRSPQRCAEIERAGAEPFIGDPDRIATLMPALEHVTVAVALLASATGTPEQLEALHRGRLEMLLHKLIDTTVRGVVYEARGSVAAGVLQAGAGRVVAACEDSAIPFVLLDADPADWHGWVRAAVAAVERVLERGVGAGSAVRAARNR